MSGADSGPRVGRSWWSRGSRVDAPVLVTGLPPSVPFGFLGSILPTSEASELRLTLDRLPQSQALSLAEKAAATAEADLETRVNRTGARPSELAHDAGTARDLAAGLAAGEQDLWSTGLSFHAYGNARAPAEQARLRLVHRLSQLGFRCRVPTFETDLLSTEPLLIE